MSKRRRDSNTTTDSEAIAGPDDKRPRGDDSISEDTGPEGPRPVARGTARAAVPSTRPRELRPLPPPRPASSYLYSDEDGRMEETRRTQAELGDDFYTPGSEGEESDGASLATATGRATNYNTSPRGSVGERESGNDSCDEDTSTCDGNTSGNDSCDEDASTDDESTSGSERSEHEPDDDATEEDGSVVSHTKRHIIDGTGNFAFFVVADGRRLDEILEVLTEKKWVNIDKYLTNTPRKNDVIARKIGNRFGIALITGNDPYDNPTEESIQILAANFANKLRQLKITTIRVPSGRENLSPRRRQAFFETLEREFRGEDMKIVSCDGVLSTPPVASRPQLMQEYHASVAAGHKGATKTYERIRQSYYWQEMRENIRKFVRRCKTCQSKKFVRMKGRKEMFISDTPEDAWEKMSMDIYGPLKRTRKGHVYVLTMQDQLTKFSVGVPLVHQEAKDVARAFASRWICLFGPPVSLLTDQGTNFMSRLMKELCKIFNIEQFRTTAYHPQSNGSIERSHHVLTQYLKMFIEKNREWDDLLDYAMFSYNTSVHEGTGYTPHELAFAAPARTPSSLVRAGRGGRLYHEYLRQLTDTLGETRRLARDNLVKAKQRSKRYYDRGQRQVTYAPGDVVWLLKEPRKGKFDAEYVGPYSIVEVFDNGNVRIKIRNKFKMTHHDKLKPYYGDSSEDETGEEEGDTNEDTQQQDDLGSGQDHGAEMEKGEDNRGETSE